MWKVWKAGENICVIWQQICARPACHPITFPFLKRTLFKYGSLCESRVRWNFQGGFWGGAAWCIFVCMQFFPIPDSWGDAGVPDNQTQKRRRFISVKGNSTTCYRLTLLNINIMIYENIDIMIYDDIKYLLRISSTISSYERPCLKVKCSLLKSSLDKLTYFDRM